MLHVLLSAAVLAGAAVAAGATMHRTARWIDREFRYGRVLRSVVAAIGIALATSAMAIVLTTGHAHDIAGLFACCATLLLVSVLFIAPYLRRTVSVTLRPRRILAIGAHPDDLELACGATLAKLVDQGHEVHTVVMSHGASGGDEHTRALEARNGSLYLRATTVNVLDFEDTALREHEQGMIAAIERTIRDVRPDVVLTHSAHDQHQDHHAVHQATMRAARQCPSILCYESPSVTRSFSPEFFVDVSTHVDVKVRAIELHRDQRNKPYMTGARARATAAFRGGQARVGFAEGFEVVRLEASAIGEF
ncbi:PIG-L deacetylase family protein [Microbacterium sp. 2216-1]|uniref:PIG-L deacetylase family protein n=1 Tax=Microbacterium sp. 2216-1 TaxID=3390053 RepID=UPI003975C95A